jgi:hypothetical protein
MARASHMRITMQNNANLPTLSLDNLDTVTGGYHDPADPPKPAPRQGTGDPPDGQRQGTLSSHLGEILGRFADLAARSTQPK